MPAGYWEARKKFDWTRVWRRLRDGRGRAGAISLAAADGASSTALAEIAARVLVEVAGADRAGVWLAHPQRPGILEGAVVDARASEALSQWRRLELSSREVNDFMHIADRPLVVLPPAGATALMGPISGMRSASWLLIRAANAGQPSSIVAPPVGLALLACERSHQPAISDAVEATLAELSVAFAAELQREELDRKSREELRREVFWKELLAGKNPSAVLEEICQAALELCGARFAAVVGLPAAGEAGALRGLAYAGAAEFAPLLQDEKVAAGCQRAAREGCAEFALGPPEEKRAGWMEPFRSNGQLHIRAMRLDAGDDPRKVFIAGRSTGDVPPDRRHTLDELCSAAALVVREESLRMAARDAEAAQAEALRRLRQAESEALAAQRAVHDRLEAEFRDLLDSLDCGVLIFEFGDGQEPSTARLRAWNSRFAQMMGFESRSLAEMDAFAGMVEAAADRFREPQEAARGWREAAEAALAGQAQWAELDLVRPARKAVERYSRPVLDAHGRRLGWLEVYRDITSQRLIQSKLLQTEKMAALGQLVSGIAHELNNPLTSIMGYAQLLMGHRGRSDRTNDVRHIFEEAERAGRIVKNLLLFAREAKPERKPVNLNEVVERTLALRSYELRVENIAVELQLAQQLPRTLADAHQLQQVVLNLIVNAEQAILHGRGQGHIRVRTRRVGASRLALEVADDGPGIASEIASRVFDPFFTTKPVGVGTGLGLSIVYGIVQEHGGEVYVESVPGRGATFVVELPVAVPRDEATEPEPALAREVEARATPTPSGHRILVVEDEPTVAQLVVDVLREEGHRVEAVLDSREGLDLLSRENFDLVICDLRMPRLDGRGLYQALVRSANPAQHRMLFITGDTLAPRALEFLERNSLPYLAKPFLVDELKVVVSRALETVTGERREAARTPSGRRANPPRPSAGLAVGERQEVSRKQ